MADRLSPVKSVVLVIQILWLHNNTPPPYLTPARCSLLPPPSELHVGSPANSEEGGGRAAIFPLVPYLSLLSFIPSVFSSSLPLEMAGS